MSETNLQLPSCEYAEVVRVDTVNHRPHPFTIGPKHVEYAADHNMGLLDQSVYEKIPCQVCKKPYHQHTYDTVGFIRLKRNCTQQEMVDFIITIPRNKQDKPVLGGRVLDGFAFLETPEKFRIQGIDQENS